MLLGSKEERQSLGVPPDNKGFRKYMAKECYWWHLLEATKGLILVLSSDASAPLPDDFDLFFRRQRLLHFQHAFANLFDDMKNAAPTESQPQLQKSAKRLVYR